MRNDCVIQVYFQEIGSLVIGQVENRIKSLCFINDFEVEFERGKGFLSKPLFVRIKVPAIMTGCVIKILEDYGAKIRELEK